MVVLAHSFSVLLVFSALLPATRGNHTWLLATWMGSSIASVSLILTPTLLLSLTTRGHLDPVAIHAARMLGSALLSVSFAAYFASRDENYHGRRAVFRSQSVAALVMIASMLYAEIHYAQWTDGHIQIAMVGSMAWLLPNIYFQLRVLHKQNGKQSSGRYEVFLAIDYMSTLLVGVAWCAFPQWFMRFQGVRQPTGIAVHVTRLLGAVLIGSSQLSQAAITFTNSDEKKSVLASRIIASLTCIPISVYAQFDDSFNILHVTLGVAGAGLSAANALLGCFIIDFMDKMESQTNKQAHITTRNEFISHGALQKLEIQNSSRFHEWGLERDDAKHV